MGGTPNFSVFPEGREHVPKFLRHFDLVLAFSLENQPQAQEILGEWDRSPDVVVKSYSRVFADFWRRPWSWIFVPLNMDVHVGWLSLGGK